MSMPQRQLKQLAKPIVTAPSEAAGRSRPRPRPSARERAVTWLRLWAAALLVAAGWMAVQTAIIATGSELVQARDVLARAERAGGELKLELASLRSVARIEAVAGERLGLILSRVDQPAPATIRHSPAPIHQPSRTVTLSLAEDAGRRLGAGEGIHPRPMLGAWDIFLDWLAGRAAEAATRD
ncbi:MAG TPA: hypothetical protein VLK32_02795 [Bacillota bacterium]|nr:hypothetical protein [Bacillota bacterium]